MKVYVKKTETNFGEEKLYKWIKQNAIKVYWRKFKTWVKDNQFVLWLLVSLALFASCVFIGFAIGNLLWGNR